MNKLIRKLVRKYELYGESGYFAMNIVLKHLKEDGFNHWRELSEEQKYSLVTHYFPIEIYRDFMKNDEDRKFVIKGLSKFLPPSFFKGVFDE